MVPLFAQKSGNINVSMSAAPKLALVPASRFTVMSISQFSMSVPRLKEVQMEAHDFELKKVPHFQS